MSHLESARRWVASRCRDISDHPTDEDRSAVMAQAVIEAAVRRGYLERELGVVNEMIRIAEEMFSGGIGVSSRMPRLIITYGEQIRGLAILMVGGGMTDIALSSALGQNMLWMMQPWVAVGLSILISAGFILIADGSFSSVSPDMPLRRIRRLWSTIRWLAVAAGVCLVPAILGRLLPVNAIVADTGTAAATVILAALVGSASSLRRTLRAAFAEHFEKRNDVLSAIHFLESQIDIWKSSKSVGGDARDKAA